MRAIIIKQFGGPEKLVIQNIRDPEPKPGHVVIRVKAFGVNHAETHMRKGEWAEAAKVSGIECLGVVKACPSGEFSVGQKVGIHGRYGTDDQQQLRVSFESQLPWEELAAIPESYSTAWTCLHRNLELSRGQTLVLGGATSALGQAGLNIAAQAGVDTIATTRNPDRVPKVTCKVSARLHCAAPMALTKQASGYFSGE